MQFQQTGERQWVAEGHRGFQRWFGLPFALVSLVPLGGAAGFFEIRSQSGGSASNPMLIPFGLIFAVVGLGIILFRSGVTIDGDAGTITRWRKALVPLWRRTRSTHDFVAVLHYKKVIRSDKSSRTVFPVELDGRSTSKSTTGEKSAKNFLVHHCRDYSGARRTAEQLAKIFEIAVIDQTDGVDKRREFSDIDLSLRERRALKGEEPSLNSPPESMRSRLSPQGEDLEIDIPALGFTIMHTLVAAAATGSIWIALVFVSFVDDGVPTVFYYAILLFGVLPFFVIMALLLNHARRSWLVLVTPHSLHVETRGWRRRSSAIPAAELEELGVSASTNQNQLLRRFGGGTPIVAVSDTTCIRFGDSLPQTESSYLAAVIRGIISAPLL